MAWSSDRVPLALCQSHDHACSVEPGSTLGAHGERVGRHTAGADGAANPRLVRRRGNQGFPQTVRLVCTSVATIQLSTHLTIRLSFFQKSI